MPRYDLPPLLDQVAKILSPDYGEPMARATVRTHVHKSGVPVEDFRKTHLPELASRLRPGLQVFLGHERTEAIVAEVESLSRRKA